MLLIACALTAAALAGPPGRHYDFEADPVGGAPEGWFVPAAVAAAGTTARVTDNTPAHGARCVEIVKTGTNLFGNLMQSFDAAPYRGLRVRLSASVRIHGTGPSSRAQMWMRVDRAGGQIGFFDNMFERPIKSSRWSEYRITGDIDADAQRINVGLMVFGPATAWIDSISFEVVGAAGGGNEAARPLAPRGLENLVAFARLLGYVRHFHPSDEAADADWDLLAIRGIRVAEPAADPAELADVLQRLFHPIAPNVRVAAGPVTGGIAPTVIQTLRRENTEPDTVEIVLDRPMPLNETTTFTITDGTATSVIQYTVRIPVPAASTWGLATMALLLLAAATLVIKRQAEIVVSG